jgi:hypothetical protein
MWLFLSKKNLIYDLFSQDENFFSIMYNFFSPTGILRPGPPLGAANDPLKITVISTTTTLIQI